VRGRSAACPRGAHRARRRRGRLPGRCATRRSTGRSTRGVGRDRGDRRGRRAQGPSRRSPRSRRAGKQAGRHVAAAALANIRRARRARADRRGALEISGATALASRSSRADALATTSIGRSSRSCTRARRPSASAALPRLLKGGNPEALDLAIDLARKGSNSDRMEAMRLLADAAPELRTRWSTSRRKARASGPRGARASTCSRARPGDPAVGRAAQRTRAVLRPAR
jgi:hypothetical protein